MYDLNNKYFDVGKFTGEGTNDIQRFDSSATHDGDPLVTGAEYFAIYTFTYNGIRYRKALTSAKYTKQQLSWLRDKPCAVFHELGNTLDCVCKNLPTQYQEFRYPSVEPPKPEPVQEVMPAPVLPPQPAPQPKVQQVVQQPKPKPKPKQPQNSTPKPKPKQRSMPPQQPRKAQTKSPPKGNKGSNGLILIIAVVALLFVVVAGIVVYKFVITPKLEQQVEAIAPIDNIDFGNDPDFQDMSTTDIPVVPLQDEEQEVDDVMPTETTLEEEEDFSNDYDWDAAGSTTDDTFDSLGADTDSTSETLGADVVDEGESQEVDEVSSTDDTFEDTVDSIE